MKNFLPRTAKNLQGFTLIELLVVVAIIAILAVIGVTVFSGVQRNARDARRKADVSAIADALEAQKTPNTTTYPATVLANFFASGVIPADPSTGTSYIPTYVTYSAGNATFCVCSTQALENGGGNATANGAAGVCAWSTTSTNGTWYCNASQQ